MLHFWPALSESWSWKPIFCLFRVAFIHRFYCIAQLELKFTNLCNGLSQRNNQNWPSRDKTGLRGFANNTGADQPVHPRSLISAFVIRFFGKYYIYACYRWNFNFLASLCSWEDRFETRFDETPKTGFLAMRAKCNELTVMSQRQIEDLTCVLMFYWIY